MSSTTQVMKGEWLKTIPFLIAVTYYYILFIPLDIASAWATFVRILPMLGNISFVFLYGVGSKDEYTYTRQILIGLTFSMLGDAVIIWPDCFLAAMVLFGIAHMYYTKAFGLNDLNVNAGLALFALSAYLGSKILPGTSGVFTIGVVLYIVCIATMLWSVTSRLISSGKNRTWTELVSCFGGYSFAVSDTFIAFDKFVAPVANAHLIIITTYYFAQFAMALSVAGTSSAYKQTQKKLQEETKGKNTKKSSDDLNMTKETSRSTTKAR